MFISFEIPILYYFFTLLLLFFFFSKNFIIFIVYIINKPFFNLKKLITIFTFILIINILSLIPYNFCFTSSPVNIFLRLLL